MRRRSGSSRAPVATGRPIKLVNIYFDTPELTLATVEERAASAAHAGRLAANLQDGGRREGGLHSRHEWEMPVAGERWRSTRCSHACDDAERSQQRLREAAPDLIALFRTDFTRTLWHVELDGAEIEAALDHGDVCAEVDGASASRADLGSRTRTEVRRRSRASHARGELGADAGLAPDDVSKAQRGIVRAVEATPSRSDQRLLRHFPAMTSASRLAPIRRRHRCSATPRPHRP